MPNIRKYMVKEAFKGKTPTKSMFEIVEEQLPALRADESLVKTDYISVDPYMLSFGSEQEIPYLQFAFQVGKVVESKSKDYPVNAYVVSHSGWSDYAVVNSTPDEMFGMMPYVPDIGNMSPSLALGALGMPGITAYLGFLEICKPAAGDTVCVTSAGGAVGSLVGQIAKIKGCTVVGIAGSDQKVKMLKDELGFHYAFNYKSQKNIAEVINKKLNKRIDCFFDNVGGSLSQEILKCLSKEARVAVCGSISTYNKEVHHSGPLTSSFQMEAFSFNQWDWTTQNNALKQIRTWIDKKDIKVKETITKGFENLPDAFIGMLKGENIGKALVKV